MSKKKLHGSAAIATTIQSQREVRIKPNDNQPSKAELEADVSIDATPEDLIRAAFSPARIVSDPDA